MLCKYAFVISVVFYIILSKYFLLFIQGHTAFDLAEKDMLKLLEELKEKQASVSMIEMLFLYCDFFSVFILTVCIESMYNQ